MDHTYTYSLLMLVTWMGVSSPGCWAKIYRRESSRENIARNSTNFTAIPQVEIHNVFGTYDPGLERDRLIQKTYYGPGYYMFPESNGCGGQVYARPGYQYGHLVSPNWPLPYPYGVECSWTLHGFDHIVFHFTDLELRGSRPSCSTDRLTFYFSKLPGVTLPFASIQVMCGFKISLQEKLIIAMGIDPLVPVRVIFRVSPSIEPEKNGFLLTWMKFPRQGFGSEMFVERSSVPVGNYTTGYLIYVADRPEVIWGNVTIRMEVTGEVLQEECGGFFAAVFNFGFDTLHHLILHCQNTSSFTAGQSQLNVEFAVQGHSRARGPWVIQIVLPSNIKATTIGDVLAHRYVFSDNEGEGSVECGMMTAQNLQSNIFGLYLINPFSNVHPTVDRKYHSNMHCGYLFGLPVFSLWDSFVHFRLDGDIEESDSCLFDYFLVGGRRLCGKGEQQLVSPFDNMILERAGGNFINVVDNETIAFSSSEPPGRSLKKAPLNEDLSTCFRSNPSVSPAYWGVSLDNMFLIYGLSVNTGEPQSGVNHTETLAVVMHNGLDTYNMECWSGFVDAGITKLMKCSASLYARFVKIKKANGQLRLCNVKIFINAADPNLDPKNVALGRNVAVTVGTPFPYATWAFGRKIVDGYLGTCLLVPPRVTTPFVTVDLGETVRVFGVRIVTTIAFASSLVREDEAPVVPRKFYVKVYPMNPGGIGQICQWKWNVTRDNTFINCRQPLNGRYVSLEQTEPRVYICELLVYSYHNVLNRNNVALFKPGQHDLKQDSYGYAPYVDGNLHTCANVTSHLHIDLRTLFRIEGFIISTGKTAGPTFHIQILDVMTEGSKYWHHCEEDKKLYNPGAFNTLRIRCSLPRVGRYVLLTFFIVGDHGNNESLSMCEIQVLGVANGYMAYFLDGVVNAALYKFAVVRPKLHPFAIGQVLNSGDVLLPSARLAVDGIRNNSNPTITCCRSGSPDSQGSARLVIDLANLFVVWAVQITVCTRNDADGQNYSVQLHTVNPIGLESLAQMKAHAVADCGSFDWIHDVVQQHMGRTRCPEHARGRYVLVARVEAQPLCVCEVEVMSVALVSDKRFGADPVLGHGNTKKMNFNFSSDSSVEGSGLTGYYFITDLTELKSLVDCGEMIHPANATILSPGYPNSYATNNDSYVCQWLVRTSVDGITVAWVDFMYLAPHPDFPGFCFADILVISNPAGQQVTLCGSAVKQAYSFQSFENDYLFVTLMVRTPFSSKDPINRTNVAGFHLRFQSYPSCTWINLIVGKDGGVQNGTVTSPMYPETTPPNALCHWTIQPVNDGFLDLYFLDFVVPGGDVYCSGGSVSISSRTLEEVSYCNERQPENGLIVTVAANDKVTVTFRTQKASHGRGFVLAYQFVKYGGLHEFGVLQYRGFNETGHTYYAKKPSTWKFSSLSNVGIFFLNLPFIPENERNGSCLNYLLVRRIGVLEGSKSNFVYPGTCQESYEVLPFTAYTVEFKPNAVRPTQEKYQIIFSFKIANTTNRPKAFVGHVGQSQSLQPFDVIPFHNVRLRTNMSTVDEKRVYVLEDGLYVISMRVDPQQGEHNSQLTINDEIVSFMTYSKDGMIVSVTGTFKLYKGDFLSVRVLYPGTIGNGSMLTVVYVSPIEGGHAFTGSEENTGQRIKSRRYMQFIDVMTYVGNIVYYPYFNRFIAPRTGIYWITMRPLPSVFGCTRPRCVMKSSLVLGVDVDDPPPRTRWMSYSRDGIPSEASAADFLDQGVAFSIIADQYMLPGTGSLLSFVYLPYNRQLYKSVNRYTAMTAIHPHTVHSSHYSVSEGLLWFGNVLVNVGCMYKSSQVDEPAVHIRHDGLYLVSLRPVQERGTTRVTFRLMVNRKLAWAAVSENSVPMGQTTVLSLTAGDILQVVVTGDQDNGPNTMISVAFVHPA